MTCCRTRARAFQPAVDRPDRSRVAAVLAALLWLVPAARGAAAEPQGSSPAAEDATRAGTDETVQRIFAIQWRDTQDVQLLLSNELGIDVLHVNHRTRTVQVEARPEVVRKVEEWLRQFDVPPHAAVVRIVLERALRSGVPPGGELVVGAEQWTTQKLAETTLEVLERGEVTQVFGPQDGPFEVHVALTGVDVERRLMRFDRFAVGRREEASGPYAQLLDTSLELAENRPKTVMTATDELADIALVVRVVGLIRDRVPEVVER